jgi:hypothetical protein
MAKQSKIQRKLVSTHRARKGKACPVCNRRMKRGATKCGSPHAE